MVSKANPNWTSRTQIEQWKHDVAWFNNQQPVGSPVWYWATLDYGPVYETTVRAPAELRESGPVVFVTGIPGFVSLRHVRQVVESKRNQIKPARVDCEVAPLTSECERRIREADMALKRWRNFMRPECGDRENLLLAAECLRHAADAAQAAFERLNHVEGEKQEASATV